MPFLAGCAQAATQVIRFVSALIVSRELILLSRFYVCILIRSRLFIFIWWMKLKLESCSSLVQVNLTNEETLGKSEKIWQNRYRFTFRRKSLLNNKLSNLINLILEWWATSIKFNQIHRHDTPSINGNTHVIAIHIRNCKIICQNSSCCRIITVPRAHKSNDMEFFSLIDFTRFCHDIFWYVRTSANGEY